MCIPGGFGTSDPITRAELAQHHSIPDTLPSIHTDTVVQCMCNLRFCNAGVRHLWGKDTGCVLKPLATLFSFDSDQQRHTTTKLINGTRSVDPQDTSKICVHNRSI